MGAPTPEGQSRGYEIPIVLHETAEFDVAAELGHKEAVPAGSFTRYEKLHPQTEFDCSQQIEESGEVALRLFFHFSAAEPVQFLVRTVSELLQALHVYDKALGGQGLGLDRTASQSGDGWLALVLRPNDQQRAADRFRRMAERSEALLPMLHHKSRTIRSPTILTSWRTPSPRYGIRTDVNGETVRQGSQT